MLIHKSVRLSFIGWLILNGFITLRKEYLSQNIIFISMISKMPINPRPADLRSHSLIS